jgi:murein DD-endopeptidase MepM/ murein hydrolase activator NlpD
VTPRPGQGGVGGSRSSGGDALRPSATGELDLLTEQVMEQGQSLRALDGLIGRARKALMGLPSRWPVRGAVNSEFGKRASPWTKEPEFHSGMDIAADRGTPVKAPAAGTVQHAGSGAEYGLYVMIDHDNGVRTLYGHLSKILVQRGQRIERGAVVGLTGNTGRSSGPHLHYEVYIRGQAVNPRAYLWDEAGASILSAQSGRSSVVRPRPVQEAGVHAPSPAPSPASAPASAPAPAPARVPESRPREEVKAESVEDVRPLPEVDMPGGLH